eukprot:2031948-Rhodomonas_salina.1
MSDEWGLRRKDACFSCKTNNNLYYLNMRKAWPNVVRDGHNVLALWMETDDGETIHSIVNFHVVSCSEHAIFCQENPPSASDSRSEGSDAALGRADASVGRGDATSGGDGGDSGEEQSFEQPEKDATTTSQVQVKPDANSELKSGP